MNVTINGYITFRCNSCSKSHTLESQSFEFKEDVSEEAQDDEYIRYLAKIDTHCQACSNHICVNIDVWEHPEAVVNYCFYGEEGAGSIQCEFDIEHYFDDQSVQEDSSHQRADDDPHRQNDDEDEDDQHAPPPIEVYMDRYDDDD